ncbi:hypothetical protein HMPREF2531_05306 [Bacteroides intestinalis]|uniref:Uncharacterized protein n=1 Tax=Bacteroides intestinalis TaxID=329854 RepID=A0A139KMX8_9BACE|nr:hypothetical protein HMPREF2531_05306 [Bacteroides intestinalis]
MAANEVPVKPERQKGEEEGSRNIPITKANAINVISERKKRSCILRAAWFPLRKGFEIFFAFILNKMMG